MKKEHEIIIKTVLISKTCEEIQNISELLESKIDWIEIAGQLFNHRLAGYFYLGLTEEQREKVPEELRKTMKLLVNSQKQETIESLDEASRIAERMSEENLHYAALKGIFFNIALYEKGIRRSNDMDFLVDETELKDFDSIMRDMGYMQTFQTSGNIKEASRKEKLIQRMNYHDLVPYVKVVKGKQYIIDVNFLFDGKDNPVESKVFGYGTEIYTDGRYYVKGLCKYTNLAFLVVHFYREATSTLWTKSFRDLSLYKVVDIINYIRKYEKQLDLIEWLRVIEDLNLKEKCFYTFYVISQFYNNAFVKETMNRLDIKDNSFLSQIRVEGKKETKTRDNSYCDEAFSYLHDYKGAMG